MTKLIITEKWEISSDNRFTFNFERKYNLTIEFNIEAAVKNFDASLKKHFTENELDNRSERSRHYDIVVES